MIEFDGDLNANDIEFLRSEAIKLYDGINPERWERVHEQDFLSIAEEILGQRCMKQSFVRCPFHGTDSTPSFRIYNNDAYCWGCSQYFDAVALVAKYHDFNRFKALLWCEEFFKLPPMENVERETIEDDERELKFGEVKERYMKFAASEVQKHKNVELAEEYLRYYFESKQEDSAMLLLQVLGPEKMAELFKEHGLE